jgi:aminoglycoside phosphotransferase
MISDIEWLHIGRERRVQTAGISQMIVFKVKSRRRLFRIRIGRYEHEKELIQEMNRIAQLVPKGKRPTFGVR